jgi:hypothetical protein
MFEVDDIETPSRGCAPREGKLVGEIARYEDYYLLCYLRGPAGIIVSLAQSLS